MIHRPLLLLLCAYLLSGCAASYVVKQTLGQWRFLNRRIPLEKALESPKLTQAQKNRLQIVEPLLSFASARFGLETSGQYRHVVYVQGSAVAYVLSAASQERLVPATWWFPFVGRVPYLGFFDREDAIEERLELKNKGFDVYLRPTVAYSTLGWFPDPLFSPMLDLNEVTFVPLLFHELTHGTLFIRDAMDINESFAEFVGNRAAVEFFEERYGAKSAVRIRAEKEWQDQLAFSEIILKLADDLRSLYDTPLSATSQYREARNPHPFPSPSGRGEGEGPLFHDSEKLPLSSDLLSDLLLDEKKRIFASFIALHQRAFEKSSYRSFFERGARDPDFLNNAVILAQLNYLRFIILFESLWKHSGKNLRQMIDVMRQNEDAVVPFLKSELHRLCPLKKGCQIGLQELEAPVH